MKEERQKQNWESRKETLRVLFNKMMLHAEMLDPYSAVIFTNPMCTVFLNAIEQVKTHNRSKSADEIINNALNDNP